MVATSKKFIVDVYLALRSLRVPDAGTR